MVWTHVLYVAETEPQASEMGTVGEGPDHEVGNPLAQNEIQGEPEFILSLENCTSVECNEYIRD
jgi:hypothetical protein